VAEAREEEMERMATRINADLILEFGVGRERGTKCMKNRKEMEREEARLDDNFRELWLVSQLRREILAVDRFAKLRCVV
jgi:hypothetical protein